MNVITLTIIGWIAGIVAVGFLTSAILSLNDTPGFNRLRFSAWLGAFLVALAVLAIVVALYFNFTAVGEARLEAWRAQSVGIHRIVEVYSATGEPIAEYEGIFNIEYDADRVEIFNTEDASRIIVYYKNGTIIVTEPDGLEEPNE